MKKRLSLVVAACVVALCAMFVCVGCSESSDYQPEEKSATVFPPTIIEDGVLRVGVNADSSPLAGMSNNNIIGIDVDIAAYIADELGLKLSIVDVGSDPAGAINEGRVDIVMGVNEESDAFETLWTSEEYLPQGVVLFSLTESNASVPTTSEDVKIAAQISSTSAWAVTNSFGEKVLTSTTNLQEAFSLLESGSVNFVAADAIVGLYAARVQDVDVTPLALLTVPSGYHVGVSSDNPELQSAVGDALTTLINGGIINVIEKKWLGQSVDLNIERIEMTASDADAAGEEADEASNSDDISAVSAEQVEAINSSAENETTVEEDQESETADNTANNVTYNDEEEEAEEEYGGGGPTYDEDEDEGEVGGGEEVRHDEDEQDEEE